MNQDLKFNDREKIESVKAGSIAALCLLVVFAIATLGNHWILAQHSQNLPDNLPDTLVDFSTVQLALAQAAGIAVSGFLFGMTYRYVIRDDRNPHLKSGAVLAFGLVRAIPQIEPGISHILGRIPNIPNLQDVWPLAILGLESLILFAAARIVLDWAIERNWVKPFS